MVDREAFEKDGKTIKEVIAEGIQKGVEDLACEIDRRILEDIMRHPHAAIVTDAPLKFIYL